MTTIESDPNARAVADDRVEHAHAWREHAPVAPMCTANGGPTRATAPPRVRMWGFWSAIALTVLVMLLSLASRLATPLAVAGERGTPSTVEVTSTSRSPVTALLWGKGVGFHIVRVPGGAAGEDAARRLPAPMLKGDVHLVSLGVAGLSVRGFGEPSRGGGVFTARSRSITIFAREGVNGVRAW